MEGSPSGEPYDIEHRIVVKGHVKSVRERAELEFDKDGSLLGGFGTTQDISSRRLVEEELRLALTNHNSGKTKSQLCFGVPALFCDIANFIDAAQGYSIPVKMSSELLLGISQWWSDE